MTVSYPTFPEQCPSCECTTFQGVEKMGSVVTMGDDGDVSHIKNDKSLNAWTSLFCADCGKMFIEDGVWVIDESAEKPPHKCIDQQDYSQLSDFEEESE